MGGSAGGAKACGRDKSGFESQLVYDWLYLVYNISARNTIFSICLVSDYVVDAYERPISTMKFVSIQTLCCQEDG